MNEPIPFSDSSSGENADFLLRTALDIGENMLKNGAAVHKAEDTIERVCRARGATHVEVFCITSLIIATIRLGNGEYASQVRRLLINANNFYRLDLLNKVSRDICEGKMTLEEAQEEIAAIKKKDAYPFWVRYIGAILVAGSFAVFFGGTLLDALAASVISLLIIFIERHTPKAINPLSYSFVCALIAGLLAIALPHIGFGEHYDMIIIGTIMILIPGLMFDTSIRDLLCGDTLAGIMQFIQSVLSAAILAFGYTLAIYLLRSIIL